MSVKRKFKAECAPLVGDSEVRKLKEKFGHTKWPRVSSASASLCRKPASIAYETCVGEDLMSIDAHVNALQSVGRNLQTCRTVKDRMAQTFTWRLREIMEGMSVEDVLRKYPYLNFGAKNIVIEAVRTNPVCAQTTELEVEKFSKR
ncbi:hypothetical protein KOW79_018007 [Hemibagrus wyckioides]|uniref:Uncharacterized protein n=1 Tax=Hemibagrus wyckioides TaxID=337641 RepID=A0A9D3N9S3_9TELE|nr:hypothetical protein KOW79_018007 [Hemibagrus wyckioides]